MSARAVDAICLHLRAACAEQNRALVLPIDVHGRVDAAHAALVDETVDRHRRRVGQLLPPSSRKIFSRMNSAARKRSSRSVISSSPNIASPPGRSSPRPGEQRIETASRFGGYRHDRGERAQRRELGHLRQQQVALAQPIDLVQRGDDARACRQQADHRAVGLRRAACLDDDHVASTSRETLRHRPVHPVVEAGAVPRLESRACRRTRSAHRGVVTIPVMR